MASRPPGRSTARHFRNDFRLIHAEVEDPVREHHVHGRRRHWQGVGAAESEIEIAQPQSRRIPLSFGEHLLHHVHPDDGAFWPDPPSGQNAVQPSAATKIKDALARSEIAQGKGIPNTSKRFRDGEG